MSNQKRPIGQRIKEGATGLAIAGALATGGCHSNLPSPPEEDTAAVGKTPVLHSTLPHFRQKVSLVINDERILISPMQGVDFAKTQEDGRRKVDAWRQHPERITHIGYEFVDLAGEIAPCVERVELAPQQRTSEGLQYALQWMSQALEQGGLLKLCDLKTAGAKDALPSGEPFLVEPVPQTRELRDPKRIAQRDGLGHEGRVDHQVARDLS